MKTREVNFGLRKLPGVLVAVLLCGCSTIPSFDSDRYVSPLAGAAVTPNTTNYTQALDCLGNYLKTANVPEARFTVGRVEDYSGKQDLVNGRRITQGAALMVISALSRTRLPIVERLDTSIAEMEFKYTDNKLIGDNNVAGDNPVRRTLAGSVIGSDYHIVGGITEVNYNIRSGSIDSSIKSVGASARYAVLDIAIDLRLVNTKTLQIVDVVSFQKQIIGTEVRAGIFRFLLDSVIDVSASDKAQEPIQRSVRMVAERAVFELIADLYKVPSKTCNVESARQLEASLKEIPAIPVNPNHITSSNISVSGLKITDALSYRAEPGIEEKVVKR
jgi:curli biogenesis system outer membrane secretion channel CsgG